MNDLTRIRARESDPATLERAQQVSDKINRRLDKQRVNLLGRMAELMPQPAGRLDLLRQMAGELAGAARDLVPCSRGCSGCCHMPTMLSQEEAEIIGREVGVPVAEPAQWFDGVNMGHRFDGVACSFLQDGICGIYAHRPFACRMHVHLDRDNTLCEIVPGESIRVPRLDTLHFDLAYARAFGGPLSIRLADIREFFPQGLVK
jgi:Fe-S-cluster containining protein